MDQDPRLSPQNKGFCILAVGNTLRGDDGLGFWVGRELDRMQLPDTEVWFRQQLLPELGDDLTAYSTIIIVDAAVTGDGACWQPFDPANDNIPQSGHQGNASLLYQLAWQLQHKRLKIFTCAIRGYEFGFGEVLSDKAQRNAGQAVEIIRDFILRAALTRV